MLFGCLKSLLKTQPKNFALKLEFQTTNMYLYILCILYLNVYTVFEVEVDHTIEPIKLQTACKFPNILISLLRVYW